MQDNFSLHYCSLSLSLSYFIQEEYIKSVSQFKLETAIEQELEAFLSGFWEVRKIYSIHIIILLYLVFILANAMHVGEIHLTTHLKCS